MYDIYECDDWILIDSLFTYMNCIYPRLNIIYNMNCDKNKITMYISLIKVKYKTLR